MNIHELRQEREQILKEIARREKLNIFFYSMVLLAVILLTILLITQK